MSHKFFKSNVEASDIISGTVAAARLPTLDAISTAAADLAMGANAITGLKDPSADQDAATKKFIEDNYDTSTSVASTYLMQSSATNTYLTQSSASATYATTGYVSSAIEGIDPKEICEAATSSSSDTLGFTWSAGEYTESSATGALSIDGVTLANDDRVLVKNDSTAAQNGIYVCSNIDGSSAVKLTRATDTDSVDGLVNAYTFIKTGGTQNAGKGFVQTTLTGSGVINSSGIGFTQFSSSVSALTSEEVQDIAGAMFSSNTETGITAVYQDFDGTIDLTVADLTVDGDTGSTAMSPGDTLKFTGGTNVQTSMSGDILTISSTDTDTQLSQEQVEDFAGPLVATGGTKTGITVTYDDVNGDMDFVTEITAGNISSHAITSGTINNFAVTSVQSSNPGISANIASGTLTLDMDDNPAISISQGAGSTNFLVASHTIPSTADGPKQMYCFTTSTGDLTLTLPRAGTQYAPVGTSFVVKLLSTGGGDVTVARYSTDKVDTVASDVTLDTAGEALRFTAIADSGNGTTTWVIS